MEYIKSPCIKICRQDSNGVCFGCQRTIEEIGNWSLYTDEQKLDVIENAKKEPIHQILQLVFSLGN